jgi:hypothetical protein
MGCRPELQPAACRVAAKFAECTAAVDAANFADEIRFGVRNHGDASAFQPILVLHSLCSSRTRGVRFGYTPRVIADTRLRRGIVVAAGNAETAAQFEEIAARLLANGESWFKIAAYRRAAAALRASAADVGALAEQGRLQELPGVGAAISTKIESYLKTGHIPLLDRLREEQGPGQIPTPAARRAGKPRTRMSPPASRPPRP